MKEFTFEKTEEKPLLIGNWDHPIWQKANTLTVDWFHQASSDHKPLTQAKALYDDDGIFILFQVEDQYVQSLQTENQKFVHFDSCVEFFVQPKEGKGYFNFEINAGGTIYLNFSIFENGVKKSDCVENSLIEKIKIFHSLPKKIEPEIQEKTTWQIEYFIPFEVMEHYVGPLGKISGQSWRANFFKCGDKTSHPHWGAWNPVGEVLNFHQPDRFGKIIFA